MSTNEVIKKIHPLGIRIFTRKRLWSEALEFDFKAESPIYPGLYYILENHFYLNKKDVLDNAKTEMFAANSLFYLFIEMLTTKQIILNEYLDRRYYLGGLFKSNRADFEFVLGEVPEEYSSNLSAELSKNIIGSIKYKGGRLELFEAIHSINDFILGKNDEYSDPSESFCLNILDKYDEQSSAIELVEKKKYLGLVRKYTVNIETYVLDLATNNFSNFKSNIYAQAKKNKSLKQFRTLIRDYHTKDLNRRLPKNNS